MEVWPIILGLTAVVIVLLVGYFVTRWGVFDDASEDGTDRVSRDDEPTQELERIPFRDKHRQLTLPMKAVVVSLVLASGVVSFYVYQFLKTGNPVEFAYVRELQYMSVAVIGVGGGVLFKDWADGRVGRLEIDFENTDGSDIDQTRTVYFLWGEAEPTDDGTVKVKSLFPSLILKLFPRKRLVGHVPRLRGDRPLGARVTYEVPRHARELDDGFYVRTQGERVIAGDRPTAVDIRFRPPYELPYKAYVAQREQLSKKEIRIESERAKRAEAEAQLRDLKRLVQNTEYQQREEILDEINRITDMVQPQPDNVTLQQPGGGRLPADQRPRSQQQHHQDNRTDGHRGDHDA